MRREHAARRATKTGDVVSLEPKRNNVTQPAPAVGGRTIIAPTGCGRSACANCRSKIGHEVRNRILQRIREIPIEEGWGYGLAGNPQVNLKMWTLTVDPALYRDSEDAYDSISRNKYLSRLAKAMGWKHWIAVVEWTKNGWPHWHVLVIRNRHRIDPIKKVKANWPPADVVRYSDTKPGKTWGDAAWYITKYLCKRGDAENAAPEWVMDRSNIRLVRSSKAVGSLRMRRKPDEVGEAVVPGETEKPCRAEVANNRAAIAKCGKSCTVLEEHLDQDTGRVWYSYVQTLDQPFRNVRRWAKRSGECALEVGRRRVAAPVGNRRVRRLLSPGKSPNVVP